MTAIVFHQGKLIADTKHTLMCNPIAFRYERKIHISSCGCFAYGNSGPSITPSFRPVVERTLRIILEQHILVTKDVSKINDFIPAHVLPYVNNLIVITRDLQYFILDKSPDVQLRLLTDGSMGIGSGGLLLVTLLRGGVPLAEAMRLTNSYDNMTGSTGDVIHTKELKPFVILGTEP